VKGGFCVVYMTVKTSINSFLDWKDSYIESAVSYRCAIDPFLKKCGNREIEDITIDDVSKLIRELKSKYSDGYIFNILTILKMYFKFVHYQGVKSINPEMIRPKRVIIVRPYPNEEDIDMMCESFDSSTFLGIRNNLLIRMLYETGARISEVLSIEIKDLDVHKNYAEVMTRKSHVPRYIMWKEETHALLLTYLGMRLARDYKANHLYIGKNGTKLTVRGAEYMFACSCSNIGVKFRVHDIRHACAHRLLRIGANVKQIGDKLGHSPNNPMSAMHYLRFNKEESLENLRKFV